MNPRLAILLLALATFPGANPRAESVDAQAIASRPPSESITVTGTRSREVIESFVQSLAIPTRAADKLARWQNGICPTIEGLNPDALALINKRLKEVATEVGAPANGSTSCGNNIAVVFTTTPQVLVDNIKKQNPELLGYYDNQDQLDKLATFTGPLQVWYATSTQDLHGHVTVDTGKISGRGLYLEVPCSQLYASTGPIPMQGLCGINPSSAHGASVTGSRLGDGLTSGLHNVIIIADPTKLGDYEIGSLSDYIAMLALAQIGSLGACQPLQSILNMLADNCSQKTAALTDNDTAFLKGLYKSEPAGTARMQKEQIEYQMQQSLSVH